MPASHAYLRSIAVCSLLAAATLAAGCTATTPKKAAGSVPEPRGDYATPAKWEPGPDFIPVQRQGRYTLVELAPASAQRDLMRQLVETNFPPSRKATVGDGLRQVLGRSGYRLCANAERAALHALPLPASHYRMGPMMLRDALLTLAGPGWDLSVDDGARQVCFTRARPVIAAALGMEPDFDTSSHPVPTVVRRSLP
ncbi:PilL N-terminal domain-containing protein [Shinella sp.]|uniref:PFGI-1 class ICE element type IV pilus protein PilL2 n=1 Tax=Shinella sp. TaxID=1870904 RepID=UPI00258EF721|nr:PilL N-terminal domain-containing protein [Shinella sp.]MCW5706936.1 PilL N-terminal domain-containing protein [Shinella sp.]